jgi:hypothetical protein
MRWVRLGHVFVTQNLQRTHGEACVYSRGYTVAVLFNDVTF